MADVRVAIMATTRSGVFVVALQHCMVTPLPRATLDALDRA